MSVLRAELEKATTAHRTDVERLEHKFLEDKNRVQKAHADTFQDLKREAREEVQKQLDMDIKRIILDNKRMVGSVVPSCWRAQAGWPIGAPSRSRTRVSVSVSVFVNLRRHQSEELKFQQQETGILQASKKEVEDQNKALARELELQLSKEKEYAAICSKRARDNKDLSAKVLRLPSSWRRSTHCFVCYCASCTRTDSVGPDRLLAHVPRRCTASDSLARGGRAQVNTRVTGWKVGFRGKDRWRGRSRHGVMLCSPRLPEAPHCVACSADGGAAN